MVNKKTTIDEYFNENDIGCENLKILQKYQSNP